MITVLGNWYMHAAHFNSFYVPFLSPVLPSLHFLLFLRTWEGQRRILSWLPYESIFLHLTFNVGCV